MTYRTEYHSLFLISTLCVNFKQIHCIDFISEIDQFVKASIIVISVHLKTSTLFALSHFLRAKVSPEMEVKHRFRDPEQSLPFS